MFFTVIRKTGCDICGSKSNRRPLFYQTLSQILRYRHTEHWRCTAKSHGLLKFTKFDEFLLHMKLVHMKTYTESQVALLAEKSFQSIGPLFQVCPLCGGTAEENDMIAHIVGHLRSLALKSLPQVYLEDEDSVLDDTEHSQQSRSTIKNFERDEESPYRDWESTWEDPENFSRSDSFEEDIPLYDDIWSDVRLTVKSGKKLPDLDEYDPIISAMISNRPEENTSKTSSSLGTTGDGGAYILPCEFVSYGSCNENFYPTEFDRWILHIVVDHLRNRLPNKCCCWFCDTYDFDARRDHLDKESNFRNRLDHIRCHIRDDGLGIDQIRPDYDFIAHIWKCGLISRAVYETAQRWREGVSSSVEGIVPHDYIPEEQIQRHERSQMIIVTDPRQRSRRHEGKRVSRRREATPSSAPTADATDEASRGDA